jgi:hypothetical protein
METVVTPVTRSTTATSRYRQDYGPQPGRDADHLIDLQLGGRDNASNLWWLDQSVNRSFGAQIGNQTRHLPPGSRIGRVRIGD